MARLPDDLRLLIQIERTRLESPGARVAEQGLLGSRRDMARLQRLYGYALRHLAPERDRVLREVARQIALHGTGFVLSRSSREADLFISWGHRVFAAVHAARRLLAFAPARDGRTLVAEWQFDFPIVDFVLRHFHRRFRDRPIVVIDRERAYVHDGCGIRLEQAVRWRPAPVAPGALRMTSALASHEPPFGRGQSQLGLTA
ncbi:MAG: DUF4130 domain-containing protein [Actinobacteria bacterium]|nr:DUF4130 domain-containing protein [Actinomycetota bacterium]